MSKYIRKISILIKFGWILPEYCNYVMLEMIFILFYEDLADVWLYRKLLWYAKYFYSKDIWYLIFYILDWNNFAEFCIRYQTGLNFIKTHLVYICACSFNVKFKIVYQLFSDILIYLKLLWIRMFFYCFFFWILTIHRFALLVNDSKYKYL